MHKLEIYLQTDSRLLRESDKGFACLVVRPDGSKWKAAGYGMATWHQAELAALRGALSKLDDNYEIHVYSEDPYVMGNLSNGNMEKWRENGFRKKDGKEITCAYLWREICQKTLYQKVVTHTGEHIHAEFLLRVIKKMREKQQEIQ